MRRLLKIFLIWAVLQLFILPATSMISGISLQQDPGAVIQSDSANHHFHIKIDSFDLVILPPSSGVQFYKDGIVFLSLSANEEKMIPEHLSFGTPDAYYAIPNDRSIGEYMTFSPSSAFPYPSEAFTFTRDFTTMYYAKSTKKDNRVKIFKAEYVAGDKKQTGWITDKTPLSFCLDNYTYTHPALSIDGKTMIFASDRKGSLGDMDLFMSRNEGDRWTEPVNMGYLINTKGNEFFPYLDTANNLYFSSDGIPGYGGYDIFISRFNQKTWDEPVNLSRHINSEIDDIAFKLSNIEGKSAFYTTRLEYNKSRMQVYRITLDSLLAVIDTAKLPNVIYGMALSENEFPSRKILAFVDTARIVPPIINEPIEFVQKDIAITPQEELVLQVDTIEIKVVETPVMEVPVARKDTITESPFTPLATVQPVTETPVKEPPVTVNEIITEPQVELIPIEPVIETPVKEPPVSEKEVITEPQVQLIPVEPKAETSVIFTPEIVEKPENVVYKVQIKSAIRPLGDFLVTVNGKNYSTNEYFYKKEYRYTIGEFTTLGPAVELQNACRRHGYPKAFVVAFEDNIRTLDPSKFKLIAPEDLMISEQKPRTESLVQADQPELKAEPDMVRTSEDLANLDIIVYKVQFLSSIRSRGNFNVNIEEKKYPASEYMYKGEYRYTVGEFSNILLAIDLQYACRRSGYPKAFVVIFKNNLRTLDPEFFSKDANP